MQAKTKDEIKKSIRLTICLFLLAFSFYPLKLCAQEFVPDRFELLSKQLDSLSLIEPGFNRQVDLSVSNVSLNELIRAIATNSEINLSIDPKIKASVVNNFSNVSTKDVLVFLCRNYSLTIEFTGTILYIKNHKAPVVYQPKLISIQYNSHKKLLSFDLKKDSLSQVIKKIIVLSGKNIILSPGLSDLPVSGFVKELPLSSALENLAFSNALKYEHTQEGLFILSAEPKKSASSKKSNKNRASGRYDLRVKNSDEISLNADQVDLEPLLIEISEKAKVDYFFYSEISEKVTLAVDSLDYETLLSGLFSNTEFTWTENQGVYLFGKRDAESLRQLTFYKLKHRNCEEVQSYIPKNLLKEVEVKEFIELNGLILSGSAPNIKEIEHFLAQIDQPVTMVMIELMIVDYSNDEGLESGIEFGLAQEPSSSSGSIYPSVDYKFGASSVNKLIKAFKGFGALNLGPVTDNFYMDISFLEQNGILDVRSTPVLSTLNGHEASMTLGNKEYYVEETNNIIGTQNPQSQQTRRWKSVDANMTITIKPNVSEDESVTLEVTFTQSDFTARIAPDAPPGTVSRDFKSLVRVQNKEMVLLGGLEENKKTDTGSGVPFLSRIPVLKWLFSKRNNTKHSSKLNIFIKPTILK